MEQRFKDPIRKQDGIRSPPSPGGCPGQPTISAEPTAEWLDGFLSGAPQLDRLEVARLGHLLRRMGH
jgi:hypothetical protein